MQLPSPTSRLQDLRSIPSVHSQTMPIRQGHGDHDGGEEYHCICWRQQASQDERQS